MENFGKILDSIFGFVKNCYESCKELRFFDVLVLLLLAIFIAISLSSCSGLYQLNKAIAYEIKYNKQQDTHTDLEVKLDNKSFN